MQTMLPIESLIQKHERVRALEHELKVIKEELSAQKDMFKIQMEAQNLASISQNGYNIRIDKRAYLVIPDGKQLVELLKARGTTHLISQTPNKTELLKIWRNHKVNMYEKYDGLAEVKIAETLTIRNIEKEVSDD